VKALRFSLAVSLNTILLLNSPATPKQIKNSTLETGDNGEGRPDLRLRLAGRAKATAMRIATS
jgi:hypothetical protein